jgi:putative SOS response-associated peptidase YedK
MAGLEGIDASTMEVIDALGATRYVYDAGDRIAKPVLRHTDFAPVAIIRDGERVVEKVRFGLPMMQGRIITNARSDKLRSSPGWKALFGKPGGHCMTAISFVVERDAQGTAYRIQRQDGGLMVVPGLVARRHYKFASTGNEYDDLGHVQITQDSNALVRTVHDRFVVELESRKKQDLWMKEGADPEELMGLLVPADDARYEMVPIDADVWTKRDADSIKPKGKPIRWGAKVGQQKLA